MKSFIYIFLGSGIGGVARYGISRMFANFYTHLFPYGTLLTNVLACFLLGIFIGLADYKNGLNTDVKLLLTVGFCGGFSTFSTFSLESLVLLQNNQTTNMLLYVFLSIILCISATFAGISLAR